MPSGPPDPLGTTCGNDAPAREPCPCGEPGCWWAPRTARRAPRRFSLDSFWELGMRGYRDLPIVDVNLPD